MNKQAKTGQTGTRPVSYYLYLITMLTLVISGFAQMPIFKRYYIADIPGLGWLAQFYTTHYLHYLGATVFIALTVYFVLDYLLGGRRILSVTISGYVRIFMLAGLLGTGIMLIIRNQAGVHLPPGLIFYLDMMHLGLVVMFLCTALYCVVLKKAWVRVK
jgi:ABC-type transport system involved in cytochrome c biogenesis permease subunit